MELGFRGTFELRYDALRERLPELDTPLIERVYIPDGALREHAVFVQGDQFPEILGGQPVGQDGIRRTVAFEHAVRYQPIRRALGFHLFRRLAERKRLGLRENVRQKNIVVPAERVERVPERD